MPQRRRAGSAGPFALTGRCGTPTDRRAAGPDACRAGSTGRHPADGARSSGGRWPGSRPWSGGCSICDGTPARLCPAHQHIPHHAGHPAQQRAHPLCHQASGGPSPPSVIRPHRTRSSSQPAGSPRPPLPRHHDEDHPRRRAHPLISADPLSPATGAPSPPPLPRPGPTAGPDAITSASGYLHTNMAQPRACARYYFRSSQHRWARRIRGAKLGVSNDGPWTTPGDSQRTSPQLNATSDDIRRLPAILQPCL